MYPFMLWRIAPTRAVGVGLSRTIGFASKSRPLFTQLPAPTFLPFGIKEDKDRIALLGAKVEEARKPRSVSLYHARGQRVERLGDDGRLRCTKCGVFKMVNSFCADYRSKYGCYSQCKPCLSEMAQYYFGFTLRGIMSRLLNSAKTRASRRGKIPSREGAGCFDLNMDYVLNLWEKQEGRCKYSDIVMNLDPYTSWRISLERLDNTFGYVPGNVVFICSEFNTSDNSMQATTSLVQGSSSWSRDKVQSLPLTILRSIPLNDAELREQILFKDDRERGKRNLVRQIAPNGDLFCASCEQFKCEEDFHANYQIIGGRQYGCKRCQAMYLSKYATSFRGFIKTRLLSAKCSAKRRREKGRISAGEFTLIFDDLLNLYQEQKGLCFYSGVRLALQPCTDWMCSIERINNERGYVIGNVALICCEFQSSDASYKATIPVNGTAQWSKEKADMLVRWLRTTQQAFCAK
eukprot:GEMP01049709.1.p1 GENE.GEMP01049709.1~~GEMP01049709.1.p1  ORF type:complete len:462 (-),score=19.17 GEMP01049709.1:104-1489(-)